MLLSSLSILCPHRKEIPSSCPGERLHVRCCRDAAGGGEFLGGLRAVSRGGFEKEICAPSFGPRRGPVSSASLDNAEVQDTQHPRQPSSDSVGAAAVEAPRSAPFPDPRVRSSATSPSCALLSQSQPTHPRSRRCTAHGASAGLQSTPSRTLVAPEVSHAAPEALCHEAGRAPSGTRAPCPSCDERRPRRARYPRANLLRPHGALD